MNLPVTRIAAVVPLLALACGKETRELNLPDGGHVRVVGVIPDKFDCQAFLPDADAIAGAPVTWSKSEFVPQQGTAPPCAFMRSDDETRWWQFTLDCRPVAESEIDLLLKARTAAADPDLKTPAIGRKAVDHSRAQLVFLDDDTPCAVWIVGPDEASRTALAQVVGPRLVRDNAPMRPLAKPR
jgi:hypothetical protein